MAITNDKTYTMLRNHRTSERASDRARKEESRRDGSCAAEENRRAREKYSRRDEKKAKEEQEREEELERDVKEFRLIMTLYGLFMREKSPGFWFKEYPLILDEEFKNDPELATKLNAEIFSRYICNACGKRYLSLTCGTCPDGGCSSDCFQNIKCKECKARLEHYYGVYQKLLEIRLKFSHVIWGGWAVLANIWVGDLSMTKLIDQIIKHYTEGDLKLYSMEEMIANYHVGYMYTLVKGDEFLWSGEYSIYLDNLFKTLPYPEHTLYIDENRMFNRVCNECGIKFWKSQCGKCSDGRCGSKFVMRTKGCENLQCKGCQANQDHFLGDYLKWANRRLCHNQKSWVSWTRDSLTPYVDIDSEN